MQAARSQGHAATGIADVQSGSGKTRRDSRPLHPAGPNGLSTLRYDSCSGM